MLEPDSSIDVRFRAKKPMRPGDYSVTIPTVKSLKIHCLHRQWSSRPSLDCYLKNRRSRGYGIGIELLKQSRDGKQLILWIELDRELQFSTYLYQKGQIKTELDFRKGKFGRAELQQFADNLKLPLDLQEQNLLSPPFTSRNIQFLPFELDEMRLLAQPAERLAIVKKIALEAKRVYQKFPQ